MERHRSNWFLLGIVIIAGFLPGKASATKECILESLPHVEPKRVTGTANPVPSDAGPDEGDGQIRIVGKFNSKRLRPVVNGDPKEYEGLPFCELHLNATLCDRVPVTPEEVSGVPPGFPRPKDEKFIIRSTNRANEAIFETDGRVFDPYTGEELPRIRMEIKTRNPEAAVPLFEYNMTVKRTKIKDMSDGPVECPPGRGPTPKKRALLDTEFKFDCKKEGVIEIVSTGDIEVPNSPPCWRRSVEGADDKLRTP